MNIYQEITEIILSGDEAALVTVIGATRSTPRGIGTKMLVKQDGTISGTIGGGAIEAEAIKLALTAIKTRKVTRHQFELAPDEKPSMACGGSMEILIEPVLQTPELYIFGAGHIAFTLSKIARLLDFKVHIIDDRAEFANRDRFPEADYIYVDDFVGVFSRLKIDKRSYIVIVTHGHKNDEKVLEQALKTPAGYIGMIGSRTKIDTIFNNLVTRGVSRELLDKVYSPIGLDIHAETPEEIAVSIIAEIIKVSRSP